DLKEQRGDERKDLEEERGDEYFAQEVAVLLNCAKEPCDVESAREVRERCAAHHQDKAAVPQFFEFGAVQRFWARCRGALNEHPISPRIAEQEEPAVLECRDCRQRRLCEARPRRLDRAGLEPELLCTAQHLCDADSGRAQAVAQLRLLGSNAMNPQQHGKGEEPLVVVLGHAWASIALSRPRNRSFGCRILPFVPPIAALSRGESAVQPKTLSPRGSRS